MIKVIIEDKYWLDLPSNLEISIIEENPMFLDDKIPSPYSLSFEIPPTAGNLKSFGYAGRLTSADVKKKVKARLFHFDIPISSGEIFLLEVQRNIKLQFKGSVDHANVLKHLSTIVPEEYNYGQYFYDPFNIDYSQAWASNYKQAMLSNALNPQDFVIAPVKVKDTDWEGLENSGGAKNYLKQYINYFNPVSQKLSVGDPAHIHTSVLPFPFVHKVIDAGFGGTLPNNPFATGDLAKLAVIAFNHKNYLFDLLIRTGYTGSYHDQPFTFLQPLLDQYSDFAVADLTIRIKSFMQNYAFNQFLKNLLKVFSMTAFPGVNYSLEFNNDVFDRNVVTKLDDKLVGDLNVTYEEGTDYNFSFTDVPEPEKLTPVQFSSVKEMYDNLYTTPVNFELSGMDLKSGQVLKLIRTLKGLQSESRVKSDILTDALYAKPNDTNRWKTEISSEVRPLSMNIEKYWWEDSNANDVISQKHWYVPVIERKDITAAPCIMFHAGMAATLDSNQHQYPFLTAHNYDHFGVKRLNTSLLPDVPDGLISKYHGRYKSWTEKDKIRVKGNFRLSPLDIKNMDIRDKFWLRGRLFYIEKKEYSLTHRGVSLVELDLIEI